MHTFLYRAVSSESTIMMFFNFAVTSVAAFFMITWLSRPHKTNKKDIEHVETIQLQSSVPLGLKVWFLPSM